MQTKKKKKRLRKKNKIENNLDVTIVYTTSIKKIHRVVVWEFQVW